MTITIRQATILDASHIANIIKLAFEEDVPTQQIELSLKQTGQRAYIAEQNNIIVGFVFGFITPAINGTSRRELDLQAVHPDYHGQGIGKKLIHHFSNDGTDADSIRALVAVGNIRMEKALSNFAYEAENQIQALYVSSQTSTEHATSAPSESHLIPVITMTYNGIWLEGKVTKQAINTALNSKKHEDDIVGAVVPVSDKTAIQALESANFDFIKQYRRWIRI